VDKLLSITVLDEDGNIINKYEKVVRKSDGKVGFWDYRNRNFIEITKTDEVPAGLPEDFIEVPCLESNTELAIKYDHLEVIRTK